MCYGALIITPPNFHTLISSKQRGVWQHTHTTELVAFEESGRDLSMHSSFGICILPPPFPFLSFLSFLLSFVFSLHQCHQCCCRTQHDGMVLHRLLSKCIIFCAVVLWPQSLYLSYYSSGMKNQHGLDVDGYIRRKKTAFDIKEHTLSRKSDENSLEGVW